MTSAVGAGDLQSKRTFEIIESGTSWGDVEVCSGAMRRASERHQSVGEFDRRKDAGVRSCFCRVLLIPVVRSRLIICGIPFHKYSLVVLNDKELLWRCVMPIEADP